MTITVGAALAQAGLAPIDAQVLLAYTLKRDRAWLVAHRDDAISGPDTTAFHALAKRRREGEPVAHLTGVREFWGLPLTVTRDVLIPRPETESLVELTLARIAVDAPLRILDLGTGSGAIALALAHERPQVQVVATDRSIAALEVARGNAQRLGLRNVSFLESDWYGAVRPGRFDIIVSNPPYIAAGDPHLVDGDLRFEPEAALTPGGDGLGALRVIIAGAPRFLEPGGCLLVEHGFDQARSVRALLDAAGFGAPLASRDLIGHWRVAGGTLSGA